mmetsp:Transcript_51173/g.165724  ORF Transcript_51173/g.165724 Transcript_51173/m.165724 type:complete len:258 (-) Transcript_51173:1148-1921(-)
MLNLPLLSSAALPPAKAATADRGLIALLKAATLAGVAEPIVLRPGDSGPYITSKLCEVPGSATTTSPSAPPRGVMRHSSVSRKPTARYTGFSMSIAKLTCTEEDLLSQHVCSYTPSTIFLAPPTGPISGFTSGFHTGLSVHSISRQASACTSKLLGMGSTCPVGGPLCPPEPPTNTHLPPALSYCSSMRKSPTSLSWRRRCPCQCCRKSSPKPSPGIFRINGQCVPLESGSRAMDIVKYWLAKSFLRHCFTSLGLPR